MKETRELLELAVSLIKSYRLAKADGKINLSDVQYLVDPALKIAPAFDNISEIPKEWVNLSEGEIEEIIGYVRQVKDDPQFVRLIYHLIGVASAVTDLARKEPVFDLE